MKVSVIIASASALRISGFSRYRTAPEHFTMGDNEKQSFFSKLIGRTANKSPSPIGTSQSTSSEYLPPLSDLDLQGYDKSTRHKLLDAELAANIRSLLPPRLQLYDEWELIYSLQQHGISLNTLYRNSNPDYQKQEQKRKKTGKKVEKGFAEGVVSNMVLFGHSDPNKGSRPHGYVLIIEDEHKNKFGCYLNEHLRVTDHKRYYGNGECFLWKCEWYEDVSRAESATKESLSENEKEVGETTSEKLTPPGEDAPPAEPERKSTRRQRFKAFMYTGINDNIIYSNLSFIAIGSSKGNNGLWIDKSLYLGVSYPCDTFGNEILNELGLPTHSFGKFKIMNLEVWRVGDLS